jgi:hypothetical protein
MARITYDSSDDEEYDMQEDEAIAMVLIMHMNKRPKHVGSLFGHEVIHRERMEADARLMRNYFNPMLHSLSITFATILGCLASCSKRLPSERRSLIVSLRKGGMPPAN